MKGAWQSDALAGHAAVDKQSVAQRPSRNPRFRVRSRCPACASEQLSAIYRCDFDRPPVSTYLLESYPNADLSLLEGAEFRIECCQRCGTLFQVEIGEDELLKLLYDQWVWDTNDPEACVPDYQFHVRHPRLVRDGHEIMTVAAQLGARTNELVTLDFGMGWGLWARIAAQLGCKSYGSDLSAKRMEFVSSKGVTTVALDEIAGLSAHFINTEQVFEHLTEPDEILARLVKALRPGGILKISVPAPNGVAKALGKVASGAALTRDQIMPVAPLEHVNCYTCDGLKRLGERYGLTPVKPDYPARFAFLRGGGADFRHPRLLLKALLRPFYQHNNAQNTYIWLRNPA